MPAGATTRDSALGAGQGRARRRGWSNEEDRAEVPKLPRDGIQALPGVWCVSG